MRFKLHKIQLKIKKNKELFLLITLILITVASIQIYNVNKNKINKSYVSLINNIYFQKKVKIFLFVLFYLKCKNLLLKLLQKVSKLTPLR